MFKYKTFSLFLGLLLSLFCVSVAGYGKECVSIADSTLRLHVVANSNSNLDQQVKLQVRDAILQQYSAKLLGVQNKQQAILTITPMLKDIEQTANRVLLKNRMAPTAKATLVNMWFETRQYEEMRMPAGEYDALRITLGEGKGQNWWCVMFPPLCLPAVSDPQQLENYYTQSQQQVLKAPRFEPRSYLWDLFMSIKNRHKT